MATDTLADVSSIIGREVIPVGTPGGVLPKLSGNVPVPSELSGGEDKVSQIIGRPVKPVSQPQQTSKPSTAASSIDNIIGRKIQPIKLDPLASQRIHVFSEATKNGITPDIAVKSAMAESAVIEPANVPEPSNWRKITSAIGQIPTGTGKTFGDVGDSLSEVVHRLWANPMGISDERWEKAQKEYDDYFAKKDMSLFGKGAVGQFAAGADAGLAKFAVGSTSPGQLALMVGTFGESALARAGAKLGIPGAEKVASTVAKLMQVQFASQMIEGTASGAEDTIKNAARGDWKGAGQAAVDGLVSGLMAHGIVTHEMATERVHGDLDKTAQEKYKAPFSQLDPYHQAEVIHDTVNSSPEYKAVEDAVGKNNAKTLRKAEKRYTDYHDRAINQAHDPDVARRTIRTVQEDRAKGEQANKDESQRQVYLRQIKDTLKKATEQETAAQEERRREEETIKQGGRAERPQRKAEQREKKAVRVATGEQIQQARNAAASTREDFDRAQAEKTSNAPRREVNSQVDDSGHVSYKANYYGEENSFGLAGDADHLGVYRETPRGVEFLTKYGTYSDSAADVYTAPDDETANTVAQLSALRHDAESGGNFSEEKYVGDLQGQIMRGEKTAAEARKEAGLSDQVELPSEVDALQSGNLKGPLADTTPADFRASLDQMAEESGMRPEEREAMKSQAGLVVRMETENNLHHIARSGDY